MLGGKLAICEARRVMPKAGNGRRGLSVTRHSLLFTRYTWSLVKRVVITRRRVALSTTTEKARQIDPRERGVECERADGINNQELNSEIARSHVELPVRSFRARSH
jgi:hypothetical protein